eukprot:scaffold7214_cov152-Skeletonema_menzelii.AAC.17
MLQRMPFERSGAAPERFKIARNYPDDLICEPRTRTSLGGVFGTDLRKLRESSRPAAIFWTITYYIHSTYCTHELAAQVERNEGWKWKSD